jgi:hypothetical protein
MDRSEEEICVCTNQEIQINVIKRKKAPSSDLIKRTLARGRCSRLFPFMAMVVGARRTNTQRRRYVFLSGTIGTRDRKPIYGFSFRDVGAIFWVTGAN